MPPLRAPGPGLGPGASMDPLDVLELSSTCTADILHQASFKASSNVRAD